MKKTLSILLALAMLLGLATAAIAEEEWITLRVETFDREITGLDVTNCWQLHYAQEHFGDPNHIKLEFVSFARWTEGDLLTTALAGGTAPDICVTYNGGLVQQCIDDEGIWQLDDLVNEYGANLKAFLGDELMTYGQSDHDGDGTAAASMRPTRCSTCAASPTRGWTSARSPRKTGTPTPARPRCCPARRRASAG